MGVDDPASEAFEDALDDLARAAKWLELGVKLTMGIERLEGAHGAPSERDRRVYVTFCKRLGNLHRDHLGDAVAAGAAFAKAARAQAIDDAKASEATSRHTTERALVAAEALAARGSARFEEKGEPEPAERMRLTVLSERQSAFRRLVREGAYPEAERHALDEERRLSNIREAFARASNYRSLGELYRQFLHDPVAALLAFDAANELAPDDAMRGRYGAKLPPGTPSDSATRHRLAREHAESGRSQRALAFATMLAIVDRSAPSVRPEVEPSAPTREPSPRPRPRVSGPPRGPIERCPTCAALEQVLELNYERGAVRPSSVDELDELTSTRTERGSNAWISRSTLMCPWCGTFYAAVRSKDEGESYGDPTEDRESITRLSVAASSEALKHANDATTNALRASFAARAPSVFDGLAALLADQRAPSLHIQKHAIVSVMETCLLEGDLARLGRALLDHPDPVVRVETALELLRCATRRLSGEAEDSLAATLQGAASAFVAERSPVPVLGAVLAEPPRPTLAADSADGALRPSDTHRAAACALRMAPEASLGVDEVTVQRLATLLAGDKGQRFDAAWALVFIVDAAPSHARLLRVALQACTPEVLASPVVSTLVARVDRLAP